MYKTFILFGLLIVIGTTGFGQNTGQQPPVVSGSTDAKASQSTTATAGSVLNAGTRLEAQLQKSIDVKKSQVGDEVVLKTSKAIKQNGETIVPKGTTLIGRITEVQQKTKDNAVSKVGMVFDRLQGKNLDVPISASIVSVAAAQVNAAASDMFATNASGSGSSSASGSTGSSSGGGLLGGVGSTVGSVVNTTTQTVGNVAGTATNTLGQTTGTVTRTVSGLQISSSAGGSASSSSTISAQGKDVRIDKGATFQLRVDGSTQN